MKESKYYQLLRDQFIAEGTRESTINALPSNPHALACGM